MSRYLKKSPPLTAAFSAALLLAFGTATADQRTVSEGSPPPTASPATLLAQAKGTNHKTLEHELSKSEGSNHPYGGYPPGKGAHDMAVERELSKSDGSDYPYGGYPKASSGDGMDRQLEHEMRRTDGEYHPAPR